MRDPVPPADLSKLRTYPLAERKSKVRVEQLGRPVEPDASLRGFLDSLPSILAADTLRALAREVVDARTSGKPVVLGCGAHVIKVGVAPVVIRLMEEGAVSALTMTGAGAIHDWEMAAAGATSEDVSAELGRGRFGAAEETGREFAEAARVAAAEGDGFGFTLGRRIVESDRPHRAVSLLGRAYELRVPVTVHVALGADVVHQHPAFDGGALGHASHLDFRKLVTILTGLSGGVYLNCGSAVQLPEVFLKALAAATNLGHPVEGLVTANLDMTRHYRTGENVLRRPTEGRGRSFELIGHHEINLPLLAAAIQVEQARRDR